MAQITINTSEEEQRKVITAIKNLQGQTVAIARIAKEANMNPNRVRYVVADLLDAGKVTRSASKAFNKHYIRYSYEVTE